MTTMAPRAGKRIASTAWRRRQALVALAAVPLALGAARAAEWPSRPLRIIVPMPPGGAADSVVRPLAERLEQRLGQSVYLDHRPGAGTIIGTQVLARSPADGYTIGLVISAHSINAALDKRTPYDVLHDFEPICLGGSFIVALVAHPSLPAGDVGELVAHAKRADPPLLYASLGVGTGTHLAGEMFNSAAGVRMVHVPYNGSAPAYRDLLTGRILLGFVTLDSALPHLRAGGLKLIGTTSQERSAAFPEFPTIGETLAGYEALGFFGFLAPAGTPAVIVGRLSAELIGALGEPDIARRFADVGVDVDPQPPDVFERLIRDGIARYARTARSIGMKID